MTKSKAAEKATISAETALESGAAAFKSSMEKTMVGYDALVSYGKDTAEAVSKSAATSAKGFETINSELYAYSKQSLEDAVTATKAVMGSKSVHEAFEVQTDFAKTAFEAYVGELTKIGELATATTKNAFAPFQGRMQAWMDAVSSVRAA